MLKTLNKKNIIIVLILWVITVSVYLNHTPIGIRSHDWDAHEQYTDFIINKHKLPAPLEGFHTYHPPLYYLINALLIPPSIRTDREKVHHFVRWISVLYGCLALIIMAWCLQQITSDTKIQFLTLLYIATIPKFVFIFSTFNNDSLATLLCIATIAISYSLYKNWSNKIALILLLVSTAAIYTKYSSIFCIGAIFLLCLKDLFLSKISNPCSKKLIGIFILSVLLFSPWMIFHNKHHTGKLLPTSFDGQLHQSISIHNIKDTLKTIIKFPPFLSKKMWDEPWACADADPSTKVNDYFAHSFVTSVIGEYAFSSPEKNVAWMILLIQFFFSLFSLKLAFRSNISKLALSIIFLAHLIQIASISRIIPPVNGCFMDFRYIAWLWVTWLVLYANALLYSTKYKGLFNFALTCGIILHIYFLFSAESS